MNSIVLRYFNAYGPPVNKRVIYDIYKKLKDNPNEIRIFGTGKEQKDYTFNQDIVTATLLVSKLNGFDTFNVGTGKGTTVIDIINILSHELQVNPKIITENTPIKGDIQKLIADISKIKNKLGWEPRTSLIAGIKKTVEWYRTLE